MPAVGVGVLEHTEVRAAVVPVEGCPQEERLGRTGRARREAGIRTADATEAPAAVLGAVDARRVDGDGRAVVRDLAFPLAELGEAGDVHDRATAVVPYLATLLDACGAGGEREVGRDAGVVVVDGNADAAHRFEHLDLERADAEVGGLQWRASRRVERVLFTVAHDAEAAVEDAEVRVQRGTDAEVELAVVLVAVEPVAVVGVAIAAHGRGDRLRRLVDRIVVELAQHCGPPGITSTPRAA